MASPLNSETPIIESNKDTVRDTYRSLEEKLNLLNIEIIAMKSFIEDQMLKLRQSRKDTALQKSPCDAYFLDQLHGALSFYGTTYDNFLLLSDFNISRDDERLKEFCNSLSLGHLIKTATCCMGTNPYSIDHIITNVTSFFYETLHYSGGNI